VAHSRKRRHTHIQFAAIVVAIRLSRTEAYSPDTALAVDDTVAALEVDEVAAGPVFT
jgi:hypothetical protein